MILLPSILRPHRFPCVLALAALAVTTVFLTVATGALAQGRYRSPDEAVAALADAVQADAPQQMMRVLGPGSEEIVLSGDAVDDAAMRRRFLAAFRAKYQIVPEGEDQAVLIVGEERWPFPIRLVASFAAVNRSALRRRAPRPLRRDCGSAPALGRRSQQ